MWASAVDRTFPPQQKPTAFSWLLGSPPGPGVQGEVSFDTLVGCAGEGRPQQQRWLVSVVCAGGASRDMALKWPALHLDPTAGVAVHLRQDRPVSVQACSGERWLQEVLLS